MTYTLVITHNVTGQKFVHRGFNDKQFLEDWVNHAVETSGGRYLSYSIVEES